MPVNGNTNGTALSQPSGNGTVFNVPQSIATVPGYPAAGQIKGAILPYWAFAAGVPTYVAPYGSLYTDTTAVLGASRFYIFVPVLNSPGTWQVIA